MILAAGLGERLKPLTKVVPKPMAPVANKPVMEHTLELLQAQGIVDLFVNLHYQPQTITDYFGDGSNFKVNLSYSLEKTLRGTAGGLKKLKRFLRADIFFVFMGDLLTDINLSPMIAFHKNKKALATIALTPVEDPTKYGVAVTSEDGRIISFQEKPSKEKALSNLINCGIYIFEPEIFDFILKDKFFDFGKDVFPLLLQEKQPLYGFEDSFYWCDIGDSQNYKKANFDALCGEVKVNIPGNQIEESLWVGEGTEIEEGVELIPPLCIGKGCLIGEKAKIIGPTVLGNGVYVEKQTILKEVIKSNGLGAAPARKRGTTRKTPIPNWGGGDSFMKDTYEAPEVLTYSDSSEPEIYWGQLAILG